MRELHFERTVWADRQLARLCPGNNIQRLGDVVDIEDFDAQMGGIISIIRIMNEAYERKAHFLDSSHEIDVITVEELENLTEDELMELCNLAFEKFGIDGQTTVEAEPEKKENLPESN